MTAAGCVLNKNFDEKYFLGVCVFCKYNIYIYKYREKLNIIYHREIYIIDWLKSKSYNNFTLLLSNMLNTQSQE